MSPERASTSTLSGEKKHSTDYYGYVREANPAFRDRTKIRLMTDFLDDSLGRNKKDKQRCGPSTGWRNDCL